MKITIVGGGTAGWIAAYFISKCQPLTHEITVVESSQIGIIGAGEGSTGILRDLISGFFFTHTVDIQKFMKETDSTPKLGIRHENWTGDGSSYFAPIDVSPTGFQLNDYIFKYSLALNGKEKMHLCSILGSEYENKDYSGTGAFHFDAFKIGNFFKNICTNEDNVKVIDAIVKNVIIDEKSEIKKIQLDNDQEIESDFFIDCTGFKRVLANKLEIPWVSCSDVLPMNSAMPFLLDYEKNEEIVAETKATALSSGWMWNIPLKTRRGCGYVFDKNFISENEAQKEVEKVIGKSIDPIRFIEFNPGYVKYFWKNNLLVLGLSSSFVEPLEASSIHNTVAQIAIFVKEFLLKEKYDTITEINQKIYNQRISFLNEITIDFISLHYQGGRSDSNFWRNIKEKEIITPVSKNIILKAKKKIPGFIMMEGMWGSSSVPLANWILAGMDIITPDQAKRDLMDDKFLEIASSRYNSFRANYIKPYNKNYIFETENK